MAYFHTKKENKKSEQRPIDASFDISLAHKGPEENSKSVKLPNMTHQLTSEAKDQRILQTGRKPISVRMKRDLLKDATIAVNIKTKIIDANQTTNCKQIIGRRELGVVRIKKTI